MSHIYKIPYIEETIPDRDSTFRWRTMDGEILTIEEMSTRHIFNSMKMLFNHLAAEHGGDPVWFNHVYATYQGQSVREVRKSAQTVVFFIEEIERRGDLPDKYKVPYMQIYNQVKGVLKLKGASDAGTEQQTKEINGDSRTRAREVAQEESWGSEDE